jgi:hypothetical protein
MPTRLTLSAYRARPGGDAEVLPHLRAEIATLRERGHITARPAAICRTADGNYLVISEWSTDTAVDDAHADTVITDVWRRKEELLEYLPPAELAGADAPFASYDLIEDA